MFTGVVREIGTVMADKNHILSIRSSLNPSIGDSVAVNGVCLTVTDVWSGGFSVEAADETRRTVPAEKLLGNVHLEPAMRIEDRLEGHIVQGHIDAIGTIRRIVPGENATEYIISVDPIHLDCIVPKGSIAIDGISLTVNGVYDDSFRITVIPHTINNTLIREYKTGDFVNIETDLFARYIKHILSRRESSKTMIEWKDIDAVNMSF